MTFYIKYNIINYIKNKGVEKLISMPLLVKYSPPIEAGASFNPPNLAKDFILQASVSEAMGFL